VHSSDEEPSPAQEPVHGRRSAPPPDGATAATDEVVSAPTTPRGVEPTQPPSHDVPPVAPLPSTPREAQRLLVQRRALRQVMALHASPQDVLAVPTGAASLLGIATSGLKYTRPADLKKRYNCLSKLIHPDKCGCLPTPLCWCTSPRVHVAYAD
jgi:hypothetical protein